MMILTFNKGESDLEDGRYLARFLGVSTFKNNGQRGRDGELLSDGIAWKFQIEHPGPMDGKAVFCISDQKITMKNKTGRMITAITGRPMPETFEFDSRKYENFYYIIYIQEGKISDKLIPQFVSARRPNDDQLKALFPPLPGDANEDDLTSEQQTILPEEIGKMPY